MYVVTKVFYDQKLLIEVEFHFNALISVLLCIIIRALLILKTPASVGIQTTPARSVDPDGVHQGGLRAHSGCDLEKTTRGGVECDIVTREGTSIFARLFSLLFANQAARIANAPWGCGEREVSVL